MTTDLFSWLRKEANLLDVNKFLYMKDMVDSLNKDFEFNKIENWIDELIAQQIELDLFLKENNILVEIKENSKQPFIHAQYIEEKSKKIWINRLWLDKYAQIMSEEQSVTLHLAHEIYHVIEEIEHPWYEKYSYRKEHSISEICAILFSQKMADLPYHPNIYTYEIGIKNNEYTKEQVLNYLIHD